MQYALEIIENDLNILILSQNTLHFLDFGGRLVGRKLVQSIYRILWHFANFSNVEVYILIVLDVSVILFVYEVSRLEC